MRLICGFWHRDGRPADPIRLDTMVAAMIEPGLKPGIACWVSGPVALAVIDFTRDAPFELGSSASGLVLAGDCRLDEIGDADAAGGCDALTVLLERKGAEGLSDVLGDFAIAAWSPREQSLLLARDAMGIRPLFVTQKDGPDFAFASLPRGLHAGGFASRRLDDVQFVREMLNAPSEPERTLFTDIARIAPSHWLRVSVQGMQRASYWRLDPALAGSLSCGPKEAAEALRAELERAVRCRVPDSGPLAAHLSGGLDSSAISVLAARKLHGQGRSLLAYSFLSSQAGAEDERPFVESVLRQESGIDWIPIVVEDWNAFFLPEMDSNHLSPVDEATPDIRVCADAAQHGARMLLSGWGGDEGATFNGRGALAEALLHGRWRYLSDEMHAIRRERGLSQGAVFKSELAHYLLPQGLRFGLKRLLKRDGRIASSLESLLQPEFAGQEREMSTIGPHAAHNRWRMLSSPHLPRRAEQWALMGARHGLAVGFPMLDRRVVELAVALPSAVFQRGGWRRRVFRDAMAGVLPDEIRWRPGKITPLEEIASMLAARRERLSVVLDELRGHPAVSRILSPDAMVRMLRVGREIGDGEAMALKRAFQAALFLQKYGDE